MHIIPKNENDKVIGQIIFAVGNDTLNDEYQTLVQQGLYGLYRKKTLEETEKLYREKPAHLIIIDESFGLPAISSFIENIRETHRNQIFMLVMEDYRESVIRWSVENKIDQFVIRPYGLDLFVDIVGKLVETKKLLRSFIQVEKRLHAYDKAINQSFMIIKSTLDGTIIEVNDDFCEVSGYEQSELIGLNYKEISSPTHSKEIIRELWSALQHKKIYKGRLTNITKSGEDFICDMVVLPILDENENVHEVVTLMQNVTELVRTGRQLIAERTEFEKRLNGIKDFYLEVFSKELRTPTHAILNFTEEVHSKIEAEQIREKDDILHGLDVVLHNGEKILGLVSSLLNISRIRSGDEEVRVSAVNVHECLPDIAQKYHTMVAENGIKINFDHDSTSRIRTDQTKFQLIADAIISNAIKYGRDEILIHFSADDEKFRFTVEDNGNGIDNPEKLLEMFQISDMMKLSEIARGVGLGLYMTKLLCEMLGFDLFIERSEQLGGAKVTISGPLDYDALKA